MKKSDVESEEKESQGRPREKDDGIKERRQERTRRDGMNVEETEE